ncbi:nuclear transport factor 2 family protein [Chryseobacterium angstadtii]|nr:nuclear transport factor 2 family protein [Chryseobacterium angstadtii]
MILKKITFVLSVSAILLSAAACKQNNNSIEKSAGSKTTDNESAYMEKVRSNASTFHQNFSSGSFEKNGPLVDENIYVNSNNAIVIGRDAFVQRIKRFHTPFPHLNLRDRIVIVDGDQVGLLYIMQDKQDGPYGEIPASGNKINVYAAEFFTMNEDALMKELLTITQLDQLKKQITGKDKVEEFEKVTLLPIKPTSVDFKKLTKKTMDNYVQYFNTRNWTALEAMFATDANIKINGTSYKGTAALITDMKKLIEKVPNVTYHLIRNVAEGDRGAIAYEVNGTVKKGSIQDVKQGVHFQFDDQGKIISSVVVFNSEDFENQLK